MWFNNCVGERNYLAFMVSIVSTFAFAVVVIVHVVSSSFRVEYGDGGQLGKIVLSWIGALLMAVFGFLLFNLIALHVYLIANGITTYQFLQARKKEEENRKKEMRQMERSASIRQSNLHQSMSNNKVMPEHTQFEKIEVLDSRKISIGREE